MKGRYLKNIGNVVRESKESSLKHDKNLDDELIVISDAQNSILLEISKINRLLEEQSQDNNQINSCSNCIQASQNKQEIKKILTSMEKQLENSKEAFEQIASALAPD